MATRLTRLRAVLAGALVLGVGATATLAAWTSQDYATGSFTASRFLTQSSVDTGNTWADNSASPGATLQLNAGSLSPGATVAATFGIRTIAGSIGGSEMLQTPTTSTTPLPDLWSYLQYRVYSSTVSTCTTTSTPSSSDWIVGDATSWSQLGAPVAANSTALAAATSSAAGSPSWFCVQVTLPSGAPNTLQGQTLLVTWLFTGTSS